MTELGVRIFKGKKYLVYNVYSMKGLTHGEYMIKMKCTPKYGENTPVKKKYVEIKGTTYFMVEIK